MIQVEAITATTFLLKSRAVCCMGLLGCRAEVLVEELLGEGPPLFRSAERGCDLFAALARWCSRLSQTGTDTPPETRGYKAGSEEGQVVPKEGCEFSRGNQADRYE